MAHDATNGPSDPRAHVASDRTSIDAYNQAIYESREIVGEFSQLRSLFACEHYLFDKYIPTGARVLDLGVGGGRTIPILTARASHYVAVDYSTNMVNACKRAHPEVDVRLMDAADLSSFSAAEFDVVVFSYNGLDYLHPGDKRRACIAEMSRVLSEFGVAIISSHNARTLFRPRRAKLDGDHLGKALAVQAYGSVRLAARMLPSKAFWSGQGYVRDSASANVMYAIDPPRMLREFDAAGLYEREVVGSSYPVKSALLFEPWYYYAFEKRARQ